LTSTLQALLLWQVLAHRRDDVHRFGGTRVPGNAGEHARVVDEVDGKSGGFDGMLAPLGLSPAGATKSFLVDLAFGAHLGHSLFKDRMRGLVCLDRRCLGVSKLRKELFDMFSTATVVLNVDST
jgi:hypothetical protein